MHEDTTSLQSAYHQEHQQHQQSQPPCVRMDTCCFCCLCFSLQSGSVIIGTFCLVIGIIFLCFGANLLDFFNLNSAFYFVDELPLFYGFWKVLTGLSLLYGVDKRKALPLKFWLYSHYLEMTMIVCVIVYYLTLLPQAYGIEELAVSIVIFVWVVVLAFVAYCTAVVDNFRREITNDVQRLCENI